MSHAASPVSILEGSLHVWLTVRDEVNVTAVAELPHDDVLLFLSDVCWEQTKYLVRKGIKNDIREG